jgi:hypothetical protein
MWYKKKQEAAIAIKNEVLLRKSRGNRGWMIEEILKDTRTQWLGESSNCQLCRRAVVHGIRVKKVIVL